MAASSASRHVVRGDAVTMALLLRQGIGACDRSPAPPASACSLPPLQRFEESRSRKTPCCASRTTRPHVRQPSRNKNTEDRFAVSRKPSSYFPPWLACRGLSKFSLATPAPFGAPENVRQKTPRRPHAATTSQRTRRQAERQNFDFVVAVIVMGKWGERGRAESPESPNCGRDPRGRGEWRLGRAIPNAAILSHHVNRSYIFCGLEDSWPSDGDGGAQQAAVPCVRDAKCDDQVGVGFFLLMRSA